MKRPHRSSPIAVGATARASSRAAVLALVAASLAGGACQKKRTEIVVGLATDLVAPVPLASVHLQVLRLPEQLPVGEQDFPISGNTGNVYELPGTYAIYSQNGSADRVRVTLTAQDNMGHPLVQRSSVLSLVPNRTLFVRLGVISACVGVNDCPTGDTCVQGRCTSEEIDSGRLPDYHPGLEGEITCAGGTVFVDTSTKKPLKVTGSSCGDGTCVEGICYAPPTPPIAGGGADGGGDGAAAGAEGGVSSAACGPCAANASCVAPLSSTGGTMSSDAGAPDGASSDAGLSDAALPDAGASDAASPDVGAGLDGAAGLDAGSSAPACRCDPGFTGDGVKSCDDIASPLDGLRWQLACSPATATGSCAVATSPVSFQTTIAGAPDSLYNVRLRFRGVVEQESYSGGVADGYWYAGGQPVDGSYNIYRLDTSAPAQHFFLNAGQAGIGQCWPIDYQETVVMNGGATITMLANAQDGQLIANHDANGQPIVVPGIRPAPAAFPGQFIQMDVVSVDPFASGNAGANLAAALDGTDWITLPVGAIYTPATGFSWEMWFRPTAPPTNQDSSRTQTLFSVADGVSCEDIYVGFGSEFSAGSEIGFVVDGVGACGSRDSTPVHYAPAGGYQADRWYHMVAVMDYAAGTQTLYLDGVMVGTKASALKPITSADRAASIGRWFDGATGVANFIGDIDEVRVYSQPLTAAQVTAHYNKGTGTYGQPSEAGLVAGWHLDESTGPTAIDYAGAAATGTYTGNVTHVAGIVTSP